jgi:hypothetical protein
MGDWYETVVDPVVDASDAPILADRVVAELVAVGLLKPLRTDCALGDSGYPPADGGPRFVRQADPVLSLVPPSGPVDMYAGVPRPR